MEDVNQVLVRLPDNAYAAIEDSGKGETLAYGRAWVTRTSDSACGFWKGETLHVRIGSDWYAEVALDRFPEPGPISFGADDPLLLERSLRAEGYPAAVTEDDGSIWIVFADGERSRVWPAAGPPTKLGLGGEVMHRAADGSYAGYMPE